MTREGSLEAPQRHPIDWENIEYYNEESLMQEMHRVFDICHGCRRCFNLCNAFPLLFDKIDESTTGELDSVPKTVYWEVVDQCYLCDMCFMTKCPYVPPHPFDLDFPHLMLRAKAVKFRKGQVRFRDKLLSSTDAIGRLASIPIVVDVVNKINKTPTTRKWIERTLAIHKDRQLPQYDSGTLRKTLESSRSYDVRNGEHTPGKVAIYSTCYINYNEPNIGHDLAKILTHNEIPYVLVEKDACCGMPKLELGDLEAVAKLKRINIPILAELASEGYAIVAAVPSCTLMYKQELPLMFPDDADVAAVCDAIFDPFEYLWLRNKDGLLKTDFKQPLGNVSYHVPCHLRVQNMGQKTRDILKMVPGTTVNTVERCSGHDGTWGVKSEHFETSMKIGKPVFKQMANGTPAYLSSDCAIAGRHILQGIGADIEKQHPLTLIRIAYGL